MHFRVATGVNLGGLSSAQLVGGYEDDGLEGGLTVSQLELSQQLLQLNGSGI